VVSSVASSASSAVSSGCFLGWGPRLGSAGERQPQDPPAPPPAPRPRALNESSILRPSIPPPTPALRRPALKAANSNPAASTRRQPHQPQPPTAYGAGTATRRQLRRRPIPPWPSQGARPPPGVQGTVRRGQTTASPPRPDQTTSGTAASAVAPPLRGQALRPRRSDPQLPRQHSGSQAAHRIRHSGRGVSTAAASTDPAPKAAHPTSAARYRGHRHRPGQSPRPWGGNRDGGFFFLGSFFSLFCSVRRPASVGHHKAARDASQRPVPERRPGRQSPSRSGKHGPAASVPAPVRSCPVSSRPSRGTSAGSTTTQEGPAARAQRPQRARRPS